LRQRYGVRQVAIVGAVKLAQSIAAGHGVLITPNHCRDEDPFVISRLAAQVGQPFFAVASAHLFRDSKVQSFLLRRTGAFSIYREGMDKQAVQLSSKSSRPPRDHW
jgi:1-acyl-sn-glycerol-3-phosphate acyltransferase